MIVKKIFHFLGSLPFAIFLITSSAFMVILGTILESKTGSHLYAAQWTYHSPIFIFLLFGYFINILFSALRRWPFQKKHIPFLTTHLGLLLILSGVILKNFLGLQGSMELVEGAGSDIVTLPNTYALKIEQFKASNPLDKESFYYHYNSTKIIPIKAKENLKIKVLGFYPHCQENYRSWIFEKEAFVEGLKPFAYTEIKSLEKLQTPLATHKVSFLKDHELWDLQAIKTPYKKECAENLYIEQTLVLLNHPQLEKLKIPLKNLLKGEYVDNFLIKGVLKFEQGDPLLSQLNVSVFFMNRLIQEYDLDLNGPIPLLTQEKQLSNLYPNFQIKLKTTPLFLITQDQDLETEVWTFDQNGIITHQSFPAKNFSSLISYLEGFGGYTVKFNLPIYNNPIEKQISLAKAFLENIPVDQENLPIPLLKAYEASQNSKNKFVEFLVDFFHGWQSSGQLFFESDDHGFNEYLSHISFTDQEINTLKWIIHTFETIQSQAWEKKLSSFQDYFKQYPQPFLKNVTEHTSDNDLLINLSNQIFSTSQLLAPSISKYSLTKLFSAYLLSFGITSNALTKIIKEANVQLSPDEELAIESPIRMNFKTEKPHVKIEDHTPLIVLEVTDGDQTQKLALAYDKSGKGLGWPILNGKYLVYFQPQSVQIPYSLRLHQAKQVNYLNTSQASSYESIILLKNKIQDETQEILLKMNHVYETWEGHRFYLANVSANENQAKKIHLIINHDPARYLITYPGTVILSLGILLIFFGYRYFYK